VKRNQQKSDEKKYDIEEFRRKKKREKLLHRLIRAAVILLLLGGAAGFLYAYEKYDLGGLLDSAQTPNAPVSQSTTMQTGSFPVWLDATNPLDMEIFGSGMVLLTNDEVAVLGSDGSVSSQYVHGFTNPVLRIGDNRYLLYDRGGYGYRVENQLGTIADGRSSNTILSGTSGHTSTFALVTTKDYYAGSIIVYGKNGRELMTWDSTEQIVDLAFSPNDRYLAAATVIFETSGVLSARVHLFDTDKQKEIAVADFSDALPIAVNILEDGTVHLVTDQFLGILTEDFSEQSKVPYLQPLRKYQFSHQNTLLVTSSANEVSSTLSLVSKNGEKQDQTIRNSITDICLNEEGLCVLAGGSIRTYSLKMEMLQTEQVASDVFQVLYNKGEVYTMSASCLDKLSRQKAAEAESSLPMNEEVSE
jgi:hypothetical protein